MEGTKNYLLVTTLDNVQGRVYSYTFNPNAGTQDPWVRRKLPVPDNSTVSIRERGELVRQPVFPVAHRVPDANPLLLGDAATGVP